jgi:hypothetical protein
VRLLRKSELHSRFPTESLKLLNAIVSDRGWPLPELRQSLTAIGVALPSLKDDPRFTRSYGPLREVIVLRTLHLEQRRYCRITGQFSATFTL